MSELASLTMMKIVLHSFFQTKINKKGQIIRKRVLHLCSKKKKRGQIDKTMAEQEIFN
jgi:hypothetical protein